MLDKQRLFLFNNLEEKPTGPVVYWMSRDQRVHDNWALLYAANKANELGFPLYVIFSLAPSFLVATSRHYSFMFGGLKEVCETLKSKGIGVEVLKGNPAETVPDFLKKVNGSFLVTDFDPLRVKQHWKEQVNASISIPHVEVDAHNVVPCRVVSHKVEFGAYTIRPKIKKLLNNFLVDFPDLPKILVPISSELVQWQELYNWLSVDKLVKPIEWLHPGYTMGMETLTRFVDKGLSSYSLLRNDPLADGQSNLSPYLHFGQISAQRVAIEVTKANTSADDKSAFLEELIVRRELSDNFCFYNPYYDSEQGFHPWAAKTLQTHKDDEREFLYDLADFENGRTHDELWNAAQIEMVCTGKMHGYMRMYWAKKILEWTKSPQQAMEFAIYLNDKYSIDGRDPNGYAGIAWSIGGVHDRAWGERPVFGKIRFMNYNGCKRKFDAKAYIEKIKIVSQK